MYTIEQVLIDRSCERRATVRKRGVVTSSNIELIVILQQERPLAGIDRGGESARNLGFFVFASHCCVYFASNKITYHYSTMCIVRLLVRIRSLFRDYEFWQRSITASQTTHYF